VTSDLLLTDSGLETVLVFLDGMDLPAFAAFPLLEDEGGRERLRRYYREHLAIAADAGTGFVLETPTWRVNREWGAELGYSTDDLRRVAHDSIAFVDELAGEWQGTGRVERSACLGPRGDGYVPGTTLMRPDEAADYHRQQVQDYKDAGADRVSALTLSYVEEAVGIAAAASDAGIPAVIGFTLETDGRLPSGTTLEEAISTVDASTASYPSWYLVNCAHPDHIAPAITEGAAWTQRIGGLRANASRRSHAELDEATELDAGDPEELAQGYVELARALPALSVVGGCCGTDVRHVAAIARAMSPA
jgi:homocysteine S-methyltransferase